MTPDAWVRVCDLCGPVGLVDSIFGTDIWADKPDPAVWTCECGRTVAIEVLTDWTAAK